MKRLMGPYMLRVLTTLRKSTSWFESLLFKYALSTFLHVATRIRVIIYTTQKAKDRYHINHIQKKFENMYLIIDSSDINSVFSTQLQNE